MPVQPMMCPRCGKEATEYDESKWQCLNPRCGAKFIYESPPEISRQEISITNTIQAATFACSGCGGIFPVLQFPQYLCTRCGETCCSECKSKGRPITLSRGRDGFQCKHCVRRTKRRGWAVAILLVLGGLLLSAMFAPPPPPSSPPMRVVPGVKVNDGLFDPKGAIAYENRGNTWSRQKKYDRAIADFDEAIHRDPRFAEPYNSRAWIWATCPEARFRDGKRAVESATRACELTGWINPNYLDTLAAAYAEAGNFNAAVRWEARGLELLPKSYDNWRSEFRLRLRLYQSKKPYRIAGS